MPDNDRINFIARRLYEGQVTLFSASDLSWKEIERYKQQEYRSLALDAIGAIEDFTRE